VYILDFRESNSLLQSRISPFKMNDIFSGTIWSVLLLLVFHTWSFLPFRYYIVLQTLLWPSLLLLRLIDICECIALGLWFGKSYLCISVSFFVRVVEYLTIMVLYDPKYSKIANRDKCMYIAVLYDFKFISFTSKNNPLLTLRSWNNNIRLFVKMCSLRWDYSLLWCKDVDNII